MTDFQFGFWAWVGKTVADFAMLGVILAFIFVIGMIAAIYEVFIQPPIRRWRGLCPKCGGSGTTAQVSGFRVTCFECSGTGKYEPKKALMKG